MTCSTALVFLLSLATGFILSPCQAEVKAKRVREKDILPILNDLRRLQQAANMQALKYNPLLVESARRWASQCKISPYEGPGEGQAIALSQGTQSFRERLCGWFRNGQAAFATRGDTPACAADGPCRTFKRLMAATATDVGCATARCDAIEGYNFGGEVLVCNFFKVPDINAKTYAVGDPCTQCEAGQRCVAGLCSPPAGALPSNIAASLDNVCRPDPPANGNQNNGRREVDNAQNAVIQPSNLGDECIPNTNQSIFCTYAKQNGHCSSDMAKSVCPRTCADSCPPPPTTTIPPPDAHCPDRKPKVCRFLKEFGACKLDYVADKFCPETCGVPGSCDRTNVNNLLNSFSNPMEAQILGIRECQDEKHKTVCQMLQRAKSCSAPDYFLELSLLCPKTCGGTGCDAQKTSSSGKKLLAGLLGLGALGFAAKSYMDSKKPQQPIQQSTSNYYLENKPSLQNNIYNQFGNSNNFGTGSAGAYGAYLPGGVVGTASTGYSSSQTSALSGLPVFGTQTGLTGLQTGLTQTGLQTGYSQATSSSLTSLNSGYGLVKPVQPLQTSVQYVPSHQVTKVQTETVYKPQLVAHCQNIVNSGHCASPDLCFKCSADCRKAGYYC